ncbi:G2/M phase-specific E3 ubiquitin-protein ligase isoform X3 [Magallana gigas]|uniref:G2/M phase-specific E3 ubiquitin-protein ligase isoform X3 n=1 Tax=Magallana gigas TaxID=29159 RepID=UPI00333E1949
MLNHIMDEILDEIGLGNLKGLFEDHKVGPKEVVNLTDAEFEKLGVVNFGDRARLRNRCRTVMKLPDSPTLIKLRELSSRRTFQKRQSARSRVSTSRRVHVGWMNKKRKNSVYSRVTGGKEVIDIEKNTTLPEMLEKFLELYFPDGENKNQGPLTDYMYYIGNYAGAKIKDVLSNGDPFTLEGYYSEIRTYPIRLYLYTSCKSIGDEDPIISEKSTDASDDDFEPLPKLVLKKSKKRKPSGDVRDKKVEKLDQPQCSHEADLRTPTTEELDCKSLPEIHVPSDSGTPTVIFKRDATDNVLPQSNTNVTAEEILRQLRENIKTDGKKNVINVDRNNVLGTKESFKREKFMAEHPLFVRFSGEKGIDDGGPSREFMRIIIQAVSESSIFEGESRRKMLLQNLLAEENGDYETYGKIIAYCLVHGGPAPTFMSEFLFGLLAYGPDSADPTIDDIVDDEYKQQVQKIEISTDISSFFDAVDPMRPLLDYIGALPLAVPKKKNELVHALCRHIAVTRIEKSLKQFTKGLKCLGVLDRIRNYPDAMRGLFVHKSDLVVDAVEMDNMFVVEFSEEGSNKYINELRIQTYWRDYLLEIEDTPDKFKSILVFVTGLDSVPPLGFSPPLKLKFRHPEADENFSVFATPYANTCFNTLSIPVTETYNAFKEVMDNALDLGCLFTDH